MTIWGYARVSTEGQDLACQFEALKAAGAKRMMKEKVSGARSDRVQLGRLAGLAAGDQVLVTRLDRLARSTRDLLNVLAVIGKRGATFRSLSDPWADTTTAHGRLMLTVLGGFAKFERSLIVARTSDGCARAVARGVKLGRRPKLTIHQQREAVARLTAGETVTDLARSYGVHHSTISRLRAQQTG